MRERLKVGVKKNPRWLLLEYKRFLFQWWTICLFHIYIYDGLVHHSLLSAYPRSVTGSTETFTNINKLMQPIKHFKLIGLHTISSIGESNIYIYIYIYIYIHTLYMFGLVGFYGISTILGYLMTNPLYTYILNCFVVSQLFCVARDAWSRDQNLDDFTPTRYSTAQPLTTSV